MTTAITEVVRKGNNVVKGCNISQDEFVSALQECRLVAIVKMGKGETDYIELRIIGKEHYYMRRVIGRGYSGTYECYPVRGGNFNKALHVVEVLARELGVYDQVQTYQDIQTIYIK